MTDIQELNQLCPSLGRIFNDLAAITDFKPPVSPPPRPGRQSVGTASDGVKRCLTLRGAYSARADELARKNRELFDENDALKDPDFKPEARRQAAEYREITQDISFIDHIVHMELMRDFPKLSEENFAIDSDWTVWTFPSSMFDFGPGLAMVIDLRESAEDHSASTTH